MSWRKLVAPLAVLLVLGFLFAWIAPQWEQVRTAQWQFNAVLLLVSALVNWTGWLVEISLWQRLMGSIGGYMPAPVARRTWFAANLTRYVPGSVWSYLSMVYLAGQQGVTQEQSLMSVLLHQLFSTGVGLLLAAGFLVTQAVPGMQTLALPLIGLGLLVVMLWPSLPVQLANIGLRVVKRPALPANQGRYLMATVLAGYVVVWSLLGLSFGLFALGVLPLIPQLLPQMSADYIAASLIGFLSLITPSGIGVREGALALLLSGLPGVPIPAAQAAVLAVAARLWITLLELLMAAWAIGWRQRGAHG